MTPSTQAIKNGVPAVLLKVFGVLLPLVLVAALAGPALGKGEGGGVSGLVATTKTKNAIAIQWGAKAGAIGYEITRNNQVIASTATDTRSHQDSGLATGTAYSYEVFAISQDNSRSSGNDVLTVSTNGLAGIGRTAVTDLRHTLRTQERVVMTWTPVPGANGYEIKRNNNVIATNGASEFWHTDIGLNAATSYSYEVAAIGPNGERSPGNNVMSVSTVSDGGLAAPTTNPPAPAGNASATVLAVGDVANCHGHEADVARILRQRSGDIVLLGDIAYPDGSAANFANCFDPHFGSMKNRMLPTPGNHEYRSSNASPYFDYFGARAGTRGQGWYSVDRGSWQIIMLNSNCGQVGGCHKVSPQYQWLEAELRSRPNACRLVGWHHPRRTSFAADGQLLHLDKIFNLLYQHGTDLLLAGHGHAYERFEQMGPDGSFKPGRGVTQFVIGTGGVPLRVAVSPVSGSTIQDNRTWGAVEFTLKANSFDYRFITAAGRGFDDSGSNSCNNR